MFSGSKPHPPWRGRCPTGGCWRWAPRSPRRPRCWASWMAASTSCAGATPPPWPAIPLALLQVEEQPVEAGVEAAHRILPRLLPHLPALQVVTEQQPSFTHDTRTVLQVKEYEENKKNFEKVYFETYLYLAFDRLFIGWGNQSGPPYH